MSGLMKTDGIITSRNIAKMIEFSIEHVQKGGSSEPQVMLTNYKNEHFGFRDIEDMFRL